MDHAVSINDLSITRGGHIKALKHVSLALPRGRITGLIGPSGAGKTTLLRCIVGRLQVPEGSVVVLGRQAGSRELRKTVSYMTQELSVYADLTAQENIMYFARMMGQAKPQAHNTARELLTLMGMAEKAHTIVGSLSGGQKQRISLAIALIGSPQLLVLDEPTVGLDPVLREKLWQLFAKLAHDGTTLIISSHSMDEASRCQDLVLIREGHVVSHSTPQELLQKTKASTVEQAFLRLVGEKA